MTNISNDHKPLVTILRKPLNQATQHIQALMMKLYRYDVTFQYVQGTQLFIADTLSRAFLPDPGDEVCVLAINSLADIADKTKNKVRDATVNDCGQQRWPETKNDIPEEAKLYFDVRDTLSQQDGIILKGEWILIPLVL